MKKVVITAVIACMALSVAAGKKGETRVDSIVYDQGMQWRIFSSPQPVKAFAVQKDLLWFAVETSLHAMNMVRNADALEYKTIGSISASEITACIADYSNNVWIGTHDGLAVKTKDGFKVFTKENGLPDNAINAITPLKNGKLWVGTDGGACVYQAGTWTSYTVDKGLCGSKVRAIAADNDNTMWFGTDKGISSLTAGQWTTHSMKTGLSWNDTKVLACDPKTNIIWAAVGDKDVNSYNGKEWKVYMEVAEGIKCIMIDTQSRIWLSTASGLAKFNGEEWITEQQKIGIPANQVSQMLRDDQGNLWFGMEKGVLRLANPYPY
jgi:ligand-binding sensor domain-containing protein